MDVVKIVGIALVALIIIIVIRQYKPEFAIYISIIAGVMILILGMDKISQIISLLNSSSLNEVFIGYCCILLSNII